jgi:hypothetical protein
MIAHLAATGTWPMELVAIISDLDLMGACVLAGVMIGMVLAMAANWRHNAE